MSWNFATRLNNLQIQVNNLAQTSLTNPLTAPLGCASYPINNATQLSATAGQNLNVNVSGGQNITLNGAVNIPNHPLTITNNTNNDSLVVTDQPGDTNVFRIDAFGNVGILQDPSITLPTGLSVNGPITCGNILSSNVINSITAGNTSIQMGGTQNNRTVSLAPTIQVDVAQSNNNNAEINYNTPSTPGWNNNSLIIKAKNQTANYTAIFNTATGQTNLVQVNTDTLNSITGGAITVSKDLNLGSNDITCGTLNYTSLNPPLPGSIATINGGEGIFIDNTTPGNPIIDNTGVIQIQAGSNVTIDNTNPQQPIINASGDLGVASLTTTNIGVNLSSNDGAVSMTPKCVGYAQFTHNGTISNTGAISPSQSLDIEFVPDSALATNILTSYTGTNIVYVFKLSLSVIINNVLGAPNLSTIIGTIFTDGVGQSEATQTIVFNASVGGQVINTINFTTSSTEAFDIGDASNTKIFMRLYNFLNNGTLQVYNLSPILECYVYDITNFTG